MASSVRAGKAERWQRGGRSRQERAGWLEQCWQGRVVVDGRAEWAIWGRLAGAVLASGHRRWCWNFSFLILNPISYCQQFSYLFTSSAFYVSARRPI